MVGGPGKEAKAQRFLARQLSSTSPIVRQTRNLFQLHLVNEFGLSARLFIYRRRDYCRRGKITFDQQYPFPRVRLAKFRNFFLYRR